MTKEAEEIGAYEARIHWGRLLDRVHAGESYVISKRHERVAVLVPLDEWQHDEDSAEAAELRALVDLLEERNAETSAQLDRAFSALAQTRRVLDEWRLEREQRRAARGDT